MTPLERAARALCSLAGNPENATMNGKPLWMDYLPEARAVIEAIREPSDAMKQAAWDFDHAQTVAHREPYSVLPDEYWQAMIDALLAEGE